MQRAVKLTPPLGLRERERGHYIIGQHSSKCMCWCFPIRMKDGGSVIMDSLRSMVAKSECTTRLTSRAQSPDRKEMVNGGEWDCPNEEYVSSFLSPL